jgi:hypothetical protein
MDPPPPFPLPGGRREHSFPLVRRVRRHWTTTTTLKKRGVRGWLCFLPERWHRVVGPPPPTAEIVAVVSCRRVPTTAAALLEGTKAAAAAAWHRFERTTRTSATSNTVARGNFDNNPFRPPRSVLIFRDSAALSTESLNNIFSFINRSVVVDFLCLQFLAAVPCIRSSRIKMKPGRNLLPQYNCYSFVRKVNTLLFVTASSTC